MEKERKSTNARLIPGSPVRPNGVFAVERSVRDGGEKVFGSRSPAGANSSASGKQKGGRVLSSEEGGVMGGPPNSTLISGKEEYYASKISILGKERNSAYREGVGSTRQAHIAQLIPSAQHWSKEMSTEGKKGYCKTGTKCVGLHKKNMKIPTIKVARRVALEGVRANTNVNKVYANRTGERERGGYCHGFRGVWQPNGALFQEGRTEIVRIRSFRKSRRATYNRQPGGKATTWCMGSH